MPDWLKKLLGIEGSDTPESSGAEAPAPEKSAVPAKEQNRPALPALSALKAADGELKTFGVSLSGGGPGTAGALFSHSAAQSAPLVPGSSVTNNYETNVGDVVVYTRGNDPAGVGREVANSLQRVVTTGNQALKGV
jgi:hypothetical protein